MMNAKPARQSGPDRCNMGRDDSFSIPPVSSELHGPLGVFWTIETAAHCSAA